MEITGKIIAVLQPRSGVSQRTGNPWMTQEYVLETHDQFPRKCMFVVFGEDRIKQFNIQLGGEYTVSFDIEAREYNGRWYNDIRAFNVQPAAPFTDPFGNQGQQSTTAQPNTPFPPQQTQQPAAQQPQQPAATAAQGDSADDLPF